MAELKITLGPLELQNPVCVSSGTYGYGEEFEDFIEPGDLGALFTKGITLKPRAGNPPPAGCRNAVGDDKFHRARKSRTRIFPRE